MKFTQTQEVFKDTLTGVCYTKASSFRPIAVIDNPGKATTFGVLLTPYGGHELVEWDDVDSMCARKEHIEKFGFGPAQWGQDVLVTEEQLASRFVSLGNLSKEIDLEAAVRRYESECCDFSYREGVIRSVTKQLHRMGTSLWPCEVYTLLKDYIRHTPPASS